MIVKFYRLSGNKEVLVSTLSGETMQHAIERFMAIKKSKSLGFEPGTKSLDVPRLILWDPNENVKYAAVQK